MRIPSLPDLFFFPLAALIAAGLIGSALLMGEDERPLQADEIREFGFVYEGQALQGLTTGPGLTAAYLTEGEREFVRITASRGPHEGVPHGGAFFALNPNQIEAFAGHSLTITARMRSPSSDGAATVEMNLFAGGRNQTNWETFELDGEFTDTIFQVSPPTCEWEQRRSLVSFWPASDAGANTIDLEHVSISIDEAQDCP